MDRDAEIAELRATVARLESERAAMGAAIAPFAKLIEDHEHLPCSAWCENMARVGEIRACQPHAIAAAAEVIGAARDLATKHAAVIAAYGQDGRDPMFTTHAHEDRARATAKLCAAVARLDGGRE